MHPSLVGLRGRWGGGEANIILSFYGPLTNTPNHARSPTSARPRLLLNLPLSPPLRFFSGPRVVQLGPLSPPFRILQIRTEKYSIPSLEHNDALMHSRAYQALSFRLPGTFEPTYYEQLFVIKSLDGVSVMDLDIFDVL